MNFFLNIILITFLIISGCSHQKNSHIDSGAVIKDSSITVVKKDSSSLNNISVNNVQNTSNNTPIVTSTVNNDFLVITASSQQWHGGIKGSGGGTNYDICIKSFLSSSQIVIDKLWIGEKYFEVSASRKFPKTSADGFSAGDTAYICASEYRRNADEHKVIDESDSQRGVSDIEQNIPVPYKYIGEALIGYKICGNRKYKEIFKITVKTPLFYP